MQLTEDRIKELAAEARQVFNDETRISDPRCFDELSPWHKDGWNKVVLAIATAATEGMQERIKELEESLRYIAEGECRESLCCCHEDARTANAALGGPDNPGHFRSR
jgi:hypothetical protein